MANNIELILIKSASEKYNITDMAVQIDWSGDINTLPRKLEIRLKVINGLGEPMLIYPEVGNFLLFFKDNKEIFRGYVFSIHAEHHGESQIVAYDQLIYTTKNQETILVKNQTATDVIFQELVKFGLINYSNFSLENTIYKIPKTVYQDQSLAQIFDDCLSQTKSATGKSYKLYSQQGHIYLTSREGSSNTNLYLDDLITASRDTSIEDVRTQVMVTRGNIDPTSSSTSTTETVMPQSTGSTAGQIFSYLISNGLTPAAACGVLGNLMQESGLNPSITNSIGAYGLAQWLGNRKAGLFSYANENDLASNSLDAQLGWLMQELRNGQNGSISIMNTMTPAQAALYFDTYFERSGGSADSRRENYAIQFYNEFANSVRTISAPVKTTSNSTSTTSSTSTSTNDESKSDIKYLARLKAYNIRYAQRMAAAEDAGHKIPAYKPPKPPKNHTLKHKSTVPKKQPASSIFVSYTVDDDDLIAQYGLMQHVKSVSDAHTAEQMEAEAIALLNKLKYPKDVFVIDFVGIESCVTGTSLAIYNEVAGIDGSFYITSDKHTWAGGDYKMNLQLSTVLE